MLYYVTVAGKTLEVKIDGDRTLINGEPVDVSLTTVPGSELRHLLLGAESHALLARSGENRGQWAISLGGHTFAAEAIDERTRTIREMSGSDASEVVKVIAAPMPGLIIRVNVEVGDAVTAGQGIVVIEAMKMENELKAPADGVVAKIAVSSGAAVEKGAVLVILE